MINEMSISHQSVIRKHSSFKHKNLGGSASIPKLLTPGYMPWGGAGGQNIEHPHSLVILGSFFFLLQMHFSFIGKAQQLLLLWWRGIGGCYFWPNFKITCIIQPLQNGEQHPRLIAGSKLAGS